MENTSSLNYEGIEYNLDSLFQFQTLKNLLVALSQKQKLQDIIIYGSNNINNQKKNLKINDLKNSVNEKIFQKGIINELNQLKKKIDKLEGKLKESDALKNKSNTEKDKKDKNIQDIVKNSTIKEEKFEGKTKEELTKNKEKIVNIRDGNKQNKEAVGTKEDIIDNVNQKKETNEEMKINNLDNIKEKNENYIENKDKIETEINNNKSENEINKENQEKSEIKNDNIISEKKGESIFDIYENNDKSNTILNTKEDINISDFNNDYIDKDNITDIKPKKSSIKFSPTNKSRNKRVSANSVPDLSNIDLESEFQKFKNLQKLLEHKVIAIEYKIKTFEPIIKVCEKQVHEIRYNNNINDLKTKSTNDLLREEKNIEKNNINLSSIKKSDDKKELIKSAGNSKSRNLEKNNENNLDNKYIKLIEECVDKTANEKITKESETKDYESKENFGAKIVYNESDTMNYIKGKQIKELADEADRIWEQIKEIKENITKINNQIVPVKEISSITTDLTTIKKFLQSFAKELDNKLNQDILISLNSKINKNSTGIDAIKGFINDQKELNQNMKNEIENSVNSFNNIKSSLSTFNKLLKDKRVLKLLEDINNISTKIVYTDDYNSDMKTLNKTINDIRLTLMDHSRNIDDILPLVKSVSTMEDLKKLEELIRQSIQKINNTSKNKFAEKNETKKQFHSLETQIKIINEINKDKKETCMLASKPIGGYKCASCETYIGDIKNKNIYLPWNKYQGDKNLIQYQYRMGSGFSRILKSLNFDSKRKMDLRVESMKNFSNGNSFDDNTISENNRFINTMCSPVNKINNIGKIPILSSKTFERNLKCATKGNENNSSVPLFTECEYGDYNSKIYATELKKPRIMKIVKKQSMTKKNASVNNELSNNSINEKEEDNYNVLHIRTYSNQ